jgi:hypothetical protein
VHPRDLARRARVDAIVAAGGAHVGADYFYAAMIFQHGDAPSEIVRARELAGRAVALDGDFAQARWMVAASTDRELMYEKKPQKYGTQYVQRDGALVLYDYDPSVTDEERARWNAPPLAEAKRRAVMMSAPR